MNLNTYESANIGDRKASKRVRAVMRSIITEQPFFGNLCLKMPLVEDSSLETIGGDGQVFRYNPKWINENTADKIKFAMARIVTGCALKHHTRRGDRDKNIWNQASLEACLPILKDSGYSDGREGTYGDIPAEKIYDILYENRQEDDKGGEGDGEGDQDGNQDGEGSNSEGNSDGEGNSESGDCSDSPNDPNGTGVILDSPEDTDIKEEEQKWDENVSQAEAFESIVKPGNKGGDYKDKILGGVAQLSWQEILRELMNETAKEDYSWTRPNRRHIHNNIYIPSMYSMGAMGSMIFAIDTSGSMETKVLADVWEEIREAVSVVKPNDVRVLQCDTRVISDEKYEIDDLPESIEAFGRGGTRFSPVFDYIDENNIDAPKVLIYLTDMGVFDGSYPKFEPEYPVIWAYYGDYYDSVLERNPKGAAPFGEAVRVDK